MTGTDVKPAQTNETKMALLANQTMTGSSPSAVKHNQSQEQIQAPPQGQSQIQGPSQGKEVIQAPPQEQGQIQIQPEKCCMVFRENICFNCSESTITITIWKF